MIKPFWVNHPTAFRAMQVLCLLLTPPFWIVESLWNAKGGLADGMRDHWNMMIKGPVNA